jgi:hypothetical protein
MKNKGYFGHGARAIAIVRSDTGYEATLWRGTLVALLMVMAFLLIGGLRMAHAADAYRIGPRLLSQAETAAVAGRIDVGFDVVAPLRPPRLATQAPASAPVPEVVEVKPPVAKPAVLAPAPRLVGRVASVQPARQQPAVRRVVEHEPTEKPGIFCLWFGLFCPTPPAPETVMVMPPPRPDYMDAIVANAKTLDVERGLVKREVYFPPAKQKKRRRK